MLTVNANVVPTNDCYLVTKAPPCGSNQCYQNEMKICLQGNEKQPSNFQHNTPANWSWKHAISMNGYINPNGGTSR